MHVLHEELMVTLTAVPVKSESGEVTDGWCHFSARKVCQLTVGTWSFGFDEVVVYRINQGLVESHAKGTTSLSIFALERQTIDLVLTVNHCKEVYNVTKVEHFSPNLGYQRW